MNPNIHFSHLFVDELARSGLRHVCIAPGSRNTPMTLAFAAHPHIRVHSLLDERCAAFFALGLAMATRQPVAVLCTSGSAAANFFPAIVEANMSQVPLLVLTADRPHELRHSGANQTMDQVKLFGGYPLWSVDMAVPEAEASELAIRNVRATAARAMAVANGLVKGVVHINLPFRKPLEPTSDEANQHVFDADAKPIKLTRGKLLPAQADVDALAELVAQHERGVIVCGPRCADAPFPQAVLELSRLSGYPVLADPLSGLRFGYEGVVGSYELAVSDASVREVDVVIRFGAVPTSAVLCGWLSRCGAAHRVHIVEHGVWADDDHRINWLLQADPALTCELISRDLSGLPRPDRSARLEDWNNLEQETRVALHTALSTGAWFDGAAVHELLEALPEGARVFVGNSLPIRHVDEFGYARSKRIEIFGSRGVSGIDGNVSTALGIAAADSSRPTVGLVGDVTLYHDMNGLLAMQRLGLNNATMMVLNNNGGAIFHRLPIAKIDPPFTELFITPHGLSFEHAAQLYGLRYAKAQSRETLRAALKARFDGAADAAQLAAQMAAQFVEVPSDAKHDLAIRKQIQAELENHRAIFN
jgi:2-succinyl-5-enolpyruvyl-6-hydroxy-3-cyclohexene-1-carboxylate synthase